MKAIMYSVIILIIGFISFAIWYHFPIVHTQHYEAVTYEGDKTITFELNVKKYRKFFRPSVIEGELIHNNKIFKSYPVTISNNAVEQFRMKLNGNINPVSFSYHNTQIMTPQFKFWELETWTITIWSKDDLQRLYISHRLEGRDAHTHDYIAPASNRVEAQQVLNELFNLPSTLP